MLIPGATEDAINAAREAFHAHLAATQKPQQQSHDTSEEDLSQLDERELEAEFAGKWWEFVGEEESDVGGLYIARLQYPHS